MWRLNPCSAVATESIVCCEIIGDLSLNINGPVLCKRGVCIGVCMCLKHVSSGVKGERRQWSELL